MLIRPEIAGAATYVPGKSIPGAIKLASNENPYGPLPVVVDAIAASAATANRYPDPAGTTLTRALAARFGVDTEQVMLGAGSIALCQQLIQATCSAGDTVVYGWRSFEAYPLLARNEHARAREIALDAAGRFDLPAIAAAVNEEIAAGNPVGLVFVCNPNNPTGTIVSKDEILLFLDAVPDDVTIVLDEAYREFGDPDFPDGLQFLRRGDGSPRENVVVLRTFSKAYGLAGLRVGYGIGHPELISAAKTVNLPFSVGSLALVAAEECLSPIAQAELDQRVKETITERERITEELRGIGVPVIDSQANFVWLPVPEQAAALDAFLLENKIVPRTFPGYGVRISVSTPEENDAVLRAMRAWAEREN